MQNSKFSNIDQFFPSQVFIVIGEGEDPPPSTAQIPYYIDVGEL